MNAQSAYLQADYSTRLVSPQEQALYDHWLRCVSSEDPSAVIERFNQLFIEGCGYPDSEVVSSLDQILQDSQADVFFQHILNRCCHILVNRWQTKRESQSAIAELIQLFETEPSPAVREVTRGKSVRRLRDIVSQFNRTEQYLMLKRLVQVMNQENAAPAASQQPLGTLIGRYPYLYEHCLLSDASPKEQQRQVRHMQNAAQKQLEVDLSQYINYRVRRARYSKDSSSPRRVERLRPATNPTLLTDREIVDSLRQFSGKVNRGRSYEDLAQNFLIHSGSNNRFKSFKDDLYEYITADVDPAYGKRSFNDALYKTLANIYPDNHNQPLNDFLMVRTCSQLFNFLIVDPAGNNHFTFIDLVNNLGAILTTGLLLKLLLLCRKVKPYMERRISTLFSHYENTKQAAVGWLVKILETLNLALSLNFGRLDLSHLLA